jgi:putative flippase GtrA
VIFSSYRQHLPRPAIEFASFAAVGVIGFVADAGTLLGLLAVLGDRPYLARIGSWLAAATVTWALNRQVTFRQAARRRAARQWARFLMANSGGAAINYGTYAALVAGSSFVHQYPVLAVAAGSLAGLSVNFLASRRLVFAPPG